MLRRCKLEGCDKRAEKDFHAMHDGNYYGSHDFPPEVYFCSKEHQEEYNKKRKY